MCICGYRYIVPYIRNNLYALAMQYTFYPIDNSIVYVIHINSHHNKSVTMAMYVCR